MISNEGKHYIIYYIEGDYVEVKYLVFYNIKHCFSELFNINYRPVKTNERFRYFWDKFIKQNCFINISEEKYIIGHFSYGKLYSANSNRRGPSTQPQWEGQKLDQGYTPPWASLQLI